MPAFGQHQHFLGNIDEDCLFSKSLLVFRRSSSSQLSNTRHACIPSTSIHSFPLQSTAGLGCVAVNPNVLQTVSGLINEIDAIS